MSTIECEWENVWMHYDPRPYVKAFGLDNLINGHCIFSEGDTTIEQKEPGTCWCWSRLDRNGSCKYLLDHWPTASYCGPEYVKRYKIKRKENAYAYDIQTDLPAVRERRDTDND